RQDLFSQECKLARHPLPLPPIYLARITQFLEHFKENCDARSRQGEARPGPRVVRQLAGPPHNYSTLPMLEHIDSGREIRAGAASISFRITADGCAIRPMPNSWLNGDTHDRRARFLTTSALLAIVGLRQSFVGLRHRLRTGSTNVTLHFPEAPS